MPIVQVSLMEGRAEEKIEKMISAVSEAVSTSLEAPIETVRVIVYEMRPHQYGVGGRPYRVVQEERKKGQS
ncbi:MAG TPA: 2-hydroxymuconate tautomerase [Acidimicrobiia bacterium]|jgi:4-oxalocrotonate tautomerase